MTEHNYTHSLVETAAVAVNAGVCLEDAGYEDNAFTNIGQAVFQVPDELSHLLLLCS